MFALPRSSWEDYDRSLISAGGGVFPRTASRSSCRRESARRSASTRRDLADAGRADAPHPLAPVDLFYNGGIGTYIKASTRRTREVKDRANDNIRVNGNRAARGGVGEGGNLGSTQKRAYRIRAGGRPHLHRAIDNSAGVDCSDHEVNVKILLALVDGGPGSSRVAERDQLLQPAEPTTSCITCSTTTTCRCRSCRSRAMVSVRTDGGAMRDLMLELERHHLLDRTARVKALGRAAWPIARPRVRAWPGPSCACCSPTPNACCATRSCESELPDDPYLQTTPARVFSPARSSSASSSTSSATRCGGSCWSP